MYTQSRPLRWHRSRGWLLSVGLELIFVSRFYSVNGVRACVKPIVVADAAIAQSLASMEPARQSYGRGGGRRGSGGGEGGGSGGGSGRGGGRMEDGGFFHHQ